MLRGCHPAARRRPGERLVKRAPLGPCCCEPFISYDGEFLDGGVFGGGFYSIIFGRLRMGKAAYVTLFSGWTFGFVWHTWFVVAGRAMRRLSPRNPVPRAYCEFCEATWYSFEALISYCSVPFGGDFSISARFGTSGRAMRRP